MSWKTIKQKFEIDYVWSVICVYVVWFIFKTGIWSGVDVACFIIMSCGLYLYLLRPIGKGIIEILLALKIRNQLFNLLAEDFGVELNTVKLLSKKLSFNYTLGHRYNRIEMKCGNEWLCRFGSDAKGMELVSDIFMKVSKGYFKKELENIMIENLAGLK